MQEMNGETPFESEKGNSSFKKLVAKSLSLLSSAYVQLLSADELQVKTTGADAVAGTATLVAGTVTVATTKVVAGSIIVLTPRGNTNAGLLDIQTITAGTSFVIRSASGTDVRVIGWSILNPQA